MTKGGDTFDEGAPPVDLGSAAVAAAEPLDPVSEPDIVVDLPGTLTAPAALAGDLEAGEEPRAEEFDASRRMALLVAALHRQGSEGEAASVQQLDAAESDEVAGDADVVARPGLGLAEQELSGDDMEDMEDMPTPPPLPELELDANLSPWGVASLGATAGEVRLPLAEARLAQAPEDGVITSAPPDSLPGVAPDDAPFQGPTAAPHGAGAAEPTAGGLAREAQRRSEPTAPIRAAGAPSKAWFEVIFDEDYLRTLPSLTSASTRSEVDFLERALHPAKEAEIIDLGCGVGRHAVELASRGYSKVTAFDLSLPLLIRGADESQRRGLKVNFVHGDFREMDQQEKFECAYCLNTSFGFFDDETNRRVLQSMRRALRVGGRLLLEVVNRDYISRGLPARLGWEGDGCLVLEEVDFNFYTSRLHNRRAVVFMDGRHIEHVISIRCYSLHELGKLLHHAGFRVLDVSGHWAHRGRFFGNDSAALIVLAERRGD
ncbi:MAG: methyltransferase domain-containing protein [Proteobacteria bacterium]|nr:methyltransferase domain-containing protein [Pseudomonadota bacterium]